MRLSDSLRALSNAMGDEAPEKIRMRYPQDVLDSLVGVFDGGVLDEIRTLGYPGDLIIPWPAEDLFIYDLSSLQDRQAGYRVNARDGSISPSWPMGHYVFADAGGSPFTINENGQVFFARHGMGTWAFESVAADLPLFLDTLAKWVVFYVTRHASNIMNDDFEVEPAMIEAIRTEVLTDLDDAGRATFIKALGL